MSINKRFDILITLFCLQDPQNLWQICQCALCNLSYILKEMKENRQQVRLSKFWPKNSCALMHRKRQAPPDLPPHISDHLLMHRLQLRCPVFPTKGLEHSWEIVRTMKGSIVINVLDQNFIFTSLSNGRKIINKSRIWLHIFKRKNERSKVLESCHLDPFARVLAELIKEGDKLLLFCLFCCYC